MKSTQKLSRIVLFCAGLITVMLCPSLLRATPYASCITNNSGTIQFHINESGGTVVVTYEDGSTNTDFDGIATGTNVGTGTYSFSLAGHSTYSIAVTKFGTGNTHLVDNSTNNGVANPNGTTNSLFIVGNLRGLDVNKNITSPYFGRIYFDRSNPGLIYSMDSDGSSVTNSAAGVAWPASTFAPYRMSIAADDYLSVGSAESATAGIYRIAPDLSTNELLLGPAGDANGVSAGVHGLIFSKPLLLGSLATGGSATLYEVDNDYPATTAQVNSDLIFSNITLASLPWENAPFIGPQIGLNIVNLQNVLPGIAQGPNGYLYFSEQRGNSAIPNLYVFDATATNLLWQSIIKTNVSDFFAVSGNGLIDCAVSTDGKYLAGLTGCGYMLICSLTNGIPDVSTLVTNALPTLTGTGSSASARGICWDVADNLYTISTADAFVRQWTLGQSLTATTTGNASGTTGFGLVSLTSTLNVYATNNPTISQANTYGNPTSGAFTIVRSGGDLDIPLTINFTYGGTASNGTYTAGATGVVVLAPGQTTTNIAITAVTDGVARRTTFLSLAVTPAPASYDLVGTGTATMSILNTATDEMIASVGAASMYNAFSNDYASVTLTRLGDTNTTVTVNSFNAAGTAVEGADYTAPTPVTFHPGDLTQTTYIYPLINGQPPVHSTTLAYSGNKTVIVGIAGGSDYTASTNTAALTIVDSANPPEQVLFADPLTDTADATNWLTGAANDNMGNDPVDIDVEFGCDLTATPLFAVPFPPNGSQHALKMTVNKSDGIAGSSAATAVNMYLTNHVFSGNYAVRFNMNVIQGDSTAAAMQTGFYDPEEGPLMGINHNGMETNLWFSGIQLGAGETNWAADGLFYWISDSGGRFDDSVGPYAAYTGNGSPSTNTGWASLGNKAASLFATSFKTNVFTCYASANVPPYNGGWTEGGPGLPVNGTETLGFKASSWSDVEIKQYHGVVTLSIDKTPIFVYTNTTMFTNGLLMLGYEDPNDGGETADTAVYYSNLRVVSVGAPFITNIGLDNAHGNVVLNFSITDEGGTFTVQSASTVTGPYTNVASTITPLSGGTFQVIVPQNGAMQFYRILQQ